MAIALNTSPTSPDGAYRKGAGVFTYIDQLAITGTANSSGNLRVDAVGIGSSLSVGDYVYYSELVGVDDVESPIVEVIAVTANNATLDTPYDAGYSGGTVRFLGVQEFKVETGYSGTVQPRRTSQTLNVRPDIDGIYRVSVVPAVKTRFNFGAPAVTTDSDYHHQVSAVAYPSAISAPTDVILHKQNVTSGTPAPICYSNFRGLISEIDTHSSAYIYKVYQESDKETTLIANASVVILRYFEGQTIDILLDSPQPSTDMSVAPGLPSGVTWITSGINYTGIRINPSATSAANGTLTLTNTSTTDDWTVNLKLYDSQDVREQCEGKELTLVWWTASGGWQVYSFELIRTYNVDGNDATIVKDAEGVRSAVDFDDLVEAIDLKAYPESEAIVDLLNTLNYSTQVYICSFTGSGGARAIDLTAFTSAYVGGGSFRAKSKAPYTALDNQFEVTIFKGEEIRAVVQ